MIKNPVGWFEIYVDDISRAKTFYEAVLKVKLDVLTDPTNSGVQMLAFPSNMEEYGASGALVQMEGFSAGGNSTLVYFSCEDCSVEEARVEIEGGKIQQHKCDIGDYGFISLALDSEGNMFGLHSQK